MIVRVAEKTIEINFCAQFDAGGGQRAFWFGLTQQQEKLAGYDVFTTTPGRLLVMQFKASAHVLSTGQRRFHAPHHQLLALQDRVRGTRDIYYVLPGFGTSQELKALALDVINNCWLLNVADIGAIDPPTRRDGLLRKNEKHYMDLDEGTGSVTIHSDPVNVASTKAAVVAAAVVSREASALDTSGRTTPAVSDKGAKLGFESFRDFDRWAKMIGSKAIGCFVPD